MVSFLELYLPDFFIVLIIINDKNIEKGFKSIMQRTSNSNDILMGSCDPAKLMLKTGVDPCLNLPVYHLSGFLWWKKLVETTHSL